MPIKDNEIFELLERLAATEEMFRTPVSTIRDVAELTDASPRLIARLLGEMRGPGELEKLVGQVGEHNSRLEVVEDTLKTIQSSSADKQKVNEDELKRPVQRGSPLNSHDQEFNPRSLRDIGKIFSREEKIGLAIISFLFILYFAYLLSSGHMPF